MISKNIMMINVNDSVSKEIGLQISRLKPAQLILIDIVENALSDICRGLTEISPFSPVVPIIHNISLPDAYTEEIFGKTDPHIVFYTGAKRRHLRYLDEHNPFTVVRDVILNTRKLVKVAYAFDVEKFVFISSCLIEAPDNLANVSINIAEKYIQAIAFHNQRIYIIIRLGNILGENEPLAMLLKKITENGMAAIPCLSQKISFSTAQDAAAAIIETVSESDSSIIRIVKPIESKILCQIVKEHCGKNIAAKKSGNYESFEDLILNNVHENEHLTSIQNFEPANLSLEQFECELDLVEGLAMELNEKALRRKVYNLLSRLQ